MVVWLVVLIVVSSSRIVNPIAQKSVKKVGRFWYLNQRKHLEITQRPDDSWVKTNVLLGNGRENFLL